MKAFPRDITVEHMTERHIGIESELGVCTGSGGSSYDNLPKAASELLIRRGMLESIGDDGGGREFRTTPISLKSLRQVRGHKYLCEYYDILKANTRVQDSGGTHIHISILDKDHPNMESNATALGMAFYKQFQKIAGRQTHWARDFGVRNNLFGRNIEEVREYLKTRLYGRHYPVSKKRVYLLKGSILNPTRHKTLEFRGPMGSNDKEEVLAWIEFLANVVKVANRKSVDGVQFKDLLKGDHISAYAGSLMGWRELTKADLNRTFNGKKL